MRDCYEEEEISDQLTFGETSKALGWLPAKGDWVWIQYREFARDPVQYSPGFCQQDPCDVNGTMRCLVRSGANCSRRLVYYPVHRLWPRWRMR